MDEPARLEVGGHSIAYRHAGAGPPLVLLHGFLCDSRVWRRQLSGLSDRFTVLAWDAPGAGLSSDPPELFTTADWVQSLAEFLDVLGISRAHIAGLSWGGILAQEFYRSRPRLVATLVLADTYAGWKGSLPAEAVERRLERCLQDSGLPPDELAARWVPEMFTGSASPELLEELSAIFADFHPYGFRLMARSSAETDSTDLLPRIAVPTLLLWGGGDRRSALDVAAQFRDAIPEAELVVIPGAGHVSNMEQPATFNEHVARFCLSRG
jgi:pimeloyl-ACP methyl ester carboxylesterase